MQQFLALPRYAFTRTNIEYAPEEMGVFGLFDGDELIYIGRADDRDGHSIRALLLGHQDGMHGGCTMKATHYTWQILSSGVGAREKELLDAYFRQWHRAPRGQQRAA